MKQIIKDMNAEILINAPTEAIFAVISNHVGTPIWVAEVKEVKLVKKGSPVNGIGAIREVNFRPAFWTTVQEEIVEYKENEGFQYKVLKMPGLLEHLGIWELRENQNGGTTVSWKVHMKFKKFHWFSLFINKFENDFNNVQTSALANLKKKLEA